MAIIHFTNYKQGQTKGGLHAVMKYTMQMKKTLWNGEKLVSGYNCDPQTAFQDFLTTKNLWHKNDGVLFYHMVQSFPKGEKIDPEQAHAAAMELAKWFEGREVLVCTHVDRDHIHSHFLINSVSLDSGKKLHMAKPELEELRQRNDAICLQFGLPVFHPKQPRKSKPMTTAEYHLAARGRSKKLQLMNLINDCMRHAYTRDQFLALMESEGCKARWEKGRKNITYTTPDGWQCRDRLLFGEKYLKENMEHEFKIRAELINGRTDETECADQEYTDTAAYSAGSVSDAEGIDRADRQHGVDSGVPETADEPHRLPDLGADGRDHSDAETHRIPSGTGWEAEREALFASQTAAAQTASAGMGWAYRSDNRDGPIRVSAAVVDLVRRLEQSQDAAPVVDATTRRIFIDRKQLKKLREKRRALGLKDDGQANEHTWEQKI